MKGYNAYYCTSVYEHHYKIFYIKIAISLLFQLSGPQCLRLWTGNVNRFRGFLVPRPDWIKVLYLFGTLGLHRLLTKTLKFPKNFKISKISKNFKISKISKNFKIFIRFKNFQEVQKISVFIKFQNSKKKIFLKFKISKFS